MKQIAGMISDIVFVTVTTRNYLHRSRALMEKVQVLAPEAQRLVVCADPTGREHLDVGSEPYRWVDAGGLGIPRYHQLALAANPTALCCALKPHAVQRAWQIPGVRRVVYLDNDIDLYRCPEEMLDVLERNSFVLTPHHLGPLPVGCIPDEMVLKSFGIYNAGMFGVRKCPEAAAFVAWWAEWMLDPRHLRYEMGYDQCWLDYVSVYCPSSIVLKHAGYNVAFWNLMERDLEMIDGVPMCGNVPLTTFHFSGFDEIRSDELGPAEQFCSARPTATTASLGKDLADSWRRHGSEECRGWGYAYGKWANGSPVTDHHRSAFQGIWDQVPVGLDPWSVRLSEEHPEVFAAIHGADATEGSGKRSTVASKFLDVSPREVMRRLKRGVRRDVS